MIVSGHAKYHFPYGFRKKIVLCFLRAKCAPYTSSCDHFNGYLTTLPVTISVIDE